MEKIYIVNVNSEMQAVDANVLEELKKEGNRGRCTVITAVKEIIAEGYGPESSVHVFMGADGKCYVVHSYAGCGCGHDNKVIDVFDNFSFKLSKTVQEQRQL